MVASSMPAASNIVTPSAGGETKSQTVKSERCVTLAALFQSSTVDPFKHK